jgi:hypothetical protein
MIPMLMLVMKCMRDLRVKIGVLQQPSKLANKESTIELKPPSGISVRILSCIHIPIIVQESHERLAIPDSR